MQIKRFEAKNMTEALRLIKRDLGPEAVILSAKDLRRENRLLGISRKIGVEVTAAVDEDAPGMRSLRPGTVYAPSADSNSGPVSAPAERKAPFPSFLHTIRDRVSLKGRSPAAAGNPAEQPELPGAAAPGGDGSGCGRQDPQGVGGAAGGGGIERYLAQTGLLTGSLSLEKPCPNLVALIGNAGVGKTATIAKMAAHYSRRLKAPVGLLSLDRRSIGGFERLRIYADGMGLPFEAVRHPGELTAARDRLKTCRLVLVDTPAVNPGDGEGVASLRSQFDALGEVTSLLALSAEGRETDLQDTAERCAVLKPVGVVITKADLTRSYGDLVNFLCRAGQAVYFFSNGPRVPLDLAPATVGGLAERFLLNTSAPSGARVLSEAPLAGAPTGSAPEPGLFLANRSSDIFHRPGCKWIRLINEAHIVEFDSFAEALNHRFKPCRYCNPQHLSITGLLSRESAAQ